MVSDLVNKRPVNSVPAQYGVAECEYRQIAVGAKIEYAKHPPQKILITAAFARKAKLHQGMDWRIESTGRLIRFF